MTDEIAERFQRETADHKMTVLRDDGLYRHLRFMAVRPNPETGKPERTSFYWFDLVTWPGVLTINGDCGTYTFGRIEDMFDFFRSRYGDRINPQYWAEKIRSGNGNPKAVASSYSQDRLRKTITEDLASDDDGRGPEADWPGVTAAAMTQLFGEHSEWNTEFEDGAREALAEFEFGAIYMATCSCGSTKGGFVSDEAAREWCREHGPRRHDHVPKDVTKLDGFAFTDAWEWDLSDWDWTYLWCCHAIVWGIARYDEHRAATAKQQSDRLAASSIEPECPSCNTDDPADFRNGCEDPWHAEAALVLAGEPADA